MKKRRTIILAFLGLFAFSFPVFAHLPRIVEKEKVGQRVIIRNPEISQAFYDELNGKPQEYFINSPSGFNLYVNLLIPIKPGEASIQERTYSAYIYKLDLSGSKEIAVLDGKNAEWTVFHEPFANDDYYKGPEFEKRMEPGNYWIAVAGQDNQNTGKYVLAVGKKEKFTVWESFRLLWILPFLKKSFFESSALYLLFTPFALIILILILVLIFAVFIFFRRKNKGPK